MCFAQERKSLSSADRFYGDGYHGNTSDGDDVTRKEASLRSSGLRSTLSVTSSDVWPLTKTSRASSTGYSSYDRRFAPAPRLHTFTLPPPQPPKFFNSETTAAAVTPPLSDDGGCQSSTGVARQRASGSHDTCLHRTQPVYTNSLAVLQSQHTLLI